MKPGASCVFTGRCPISSQSFHARSKLSGDVLMPGDISTNFMSWAGRQKCMPTKRSSRFDFAAISVIDRVEVLEANSVSGPQTSFRAEKSRSEEHKSEAQSIMRI